MLTPFLLSLSIYFFFWLINYGGLLGDFIKSKILPKLPEKVQYAMKCVFCFMFWISIFIVPFSSLAWWVIFVIPIYGLFINLAYLSLSK